MKSSKYDIIVSQIQEVISTGEGGLLLQKLENDYDTKDENEFSNYLLILLILLEQPTYYEMASNLLVRKILANKQELPIEDLFNLLFENKFLPYIGLSNTICRLISTIIYNRQEENNIISKLPSKSYLLKVNVDILRDYLLIIPLDETKAINLLYNCVSDIEEPDKHIILDKTALTSFRKKLYEDQYFLNEYLSNFFRFYWYGGSRDYYEGKLIVPEPFHKQIFKGSDIFIKFIEQKKNSLINNDIKILISDILEFMKFNGDRSKGLPYDKFNLTIKLHKNISSELSG
jgi:hypothetical protein